MVQHLEGGIIRELKVRDGEVVREGQPLIVLEPVQPRSAHETLLSQKHALLSRKARLEAEKNGLSSVEFPDELYSGGELIPLAASQREMFGARMAAHAARRNVQKQRIEQLSEQIKGLNAQISNVSTQLALIQEEVAGKQELLIKGLIPKPEALRLRRAESELAARRSEFEAEIGKTTQQIEESNLQILSADALRLDEITTELDKVSNELTELAERLRASEDVLNRTTITAPVSGTVINMRFKTVGGVLQRGEAVLEIVPKDDTLVIEARVSPNDIQLLHPGQAAQIHLTAYSARVMPRINGIVRSVSADRVTDPNGYHSYFLARVEVAREELMKRAKDVSLLPGMSAEVIFVTEERTLLRYLLSPIADVLRRGMRES
jgi:HlyD family secretion protein/epimerase transport system membrane fusion protein